MFSVYFLKDVYSLLNGMTIALRFEVMASVPPGQDRIQYNLIIIEHKQAPYIVRASACRAGMIGLKCYSSTNIVQSHHCQLVHNVSAYILIYWVFSKFVIYYTQYKALYCTKHTLPVSCSYVHVLRYSLVLITLHTTSSVYTQISHWDIL